MQNSLKPPLTESNLPENLQESFLYFNHALTPADGFLFLGLVVILVALTIWSIHRSIYPPIRMVPLLLFRIIVLCLIFFYYLDPMIQEYRLVPTLLEMPVVIDGSFSMDNRSDEGDCSLFQKSLRNLEAFQKQLSDENSRWKISPFIYRQQFSAIGSPLEVSQGSTQQEPENPHRNTTDTSSMDRGKPFDWNRFLHWINTPDYPYPFTILITDTQFPVDVKHLPSLKKPLFLMPLPSKDEFGVDESWNEGSQGFLILQSSLSNPLPVIMERYHPSDSAIRKDILLKPGKQTLQWENPLDENDPKIIRIQVKSERAYENPWNKWAYQRVPAKKSVPAACFVFVGFPSYDTAFTLRILQNNRTNKVLVFQPLHNQNIHFPPKISNKDTVLIWNPTESTFGSDQCEAFVNYAKQGGTLFLFLGDSNIARVTKSSLAPLLPFQSLQGSLSPGLGPQPAQPTSLGMEQDLITFRNAYTAKRIWRDLSCFYVPSYKYSFKESVRVYAEVAEKPAIVSESIGEGEIVSLMMSGFWQMDFSRTDEGIESGYLPSFLDEILLRKSDRGINSSVSSVSASIIEPEESTTVYINSRTKSVSSIRVEEDAGTAYDVALTQDPTTGLLSVRLRFNLPGEKRIIVDGEVVERIYVTYPKAEEYPAWDDSILNAIKRWLNTSGGELIMNDLTDVAPFLTEQNRLEPQKRTIRLFDAYPTLLVVLLCVTVLVLSAEWLVRRFFWKYT